MDALPPSVELASDISDTEWVRRGLREWGRGKGVLVTSIVPEGFDSYARIEHGDRAGVGEIPKDDLKVLTDLLSRFTSTIESCWFCIWDGYGFWWKGAHAQTSIPAVRGNTDYDRVADERDRIMRRAPLLKVFARDYFVFRGPLLAVHALHGWEQTPNLWWPHDRAWCVGTDIDLTDTYVGGSEECVEALLGVVDLKATRVGPGDDINEPRR